MCFQRYKAYPDGAEKVQSGENPAKSVRPHLRTTPFAQRRFLQFPGKSSPYLIPLWKITSSLQQSILRQ